MNIAVLLRQAIDRLDAHGIAAARLDARLLLQKAAGLSQEDILTAPEKTLTIERQNIFEKYLLRRIQGEPVSRILGQRSFWGLDFIIAAGVFDPRPESETLVEAALEHLRNKKTAHVLDLGTGSGCLLLSILHASPEARGVGVDILPEAVRTAQYNARRLDLSRRAHFLAGDWMFDYMGAFDLVISNPPYIPQADIDALAPEIRHDPMSALNGGADGLDAYRRLAALMPALLAPHGHIIVEIAEGCAEKVSGIFTLAGLAIDGIINDLSGHQRVIVASGGET